MAMTVADLFDIPAFAGFKIIAGRKGVDREVQNINMMDAPDIIDFLKQNDWLVTSGYHLRGDTPFFIRLVKQMAELGCAALGVKTRRFLDGIPAEVTDLADKLAFPLIDIPNSISLVEIVNQTLSHILDIRTRELRFAIDTHQEFTDHIMSGKGTDKLLESLSNLIHFPVLLLDPYFKPIASAPLHSDTAAAADGLSMIGDSFFLAKTIYSSLTLLKEHRTLSVFPVYTYGKKRCFLVVGGKVPPSDRLLILTIEQAANVLAFELMKEEALKQSERKVRDEFFTNLVTGAFSSEKETMNRAEEFGLKNKQEYVCIVGKPDMSEKNVSFAAYQMETNRVYECLEGEIAGLPLPAHFFVKGNLCAILLEMGEPWEHIQSLIKKHLRKMQRDVERLFSRTISFGISNVGRRLLDVPEAFKEGMDALQTGQRAGHPAFIQAYQAKDIMEVLRMVPIDDLKELYIDSLQQLADPHQDEDHVLLHTLFVYLETHCQISETAKRLYVHRNTVIYRIEKCEKLLGQDLKDPDTTFRLRFALRLKPLLDEVFGPGRAQGG